VSNGVDVYGFFDLPQGLRYSADALVENLQMHGHRSRLHRVSAALRESEIKPAGPIGSTVNLVHLNPDQVPAVLGQRHEDASFETRLNAIVPYWEVTAIPIAWRPVLSAMDVIVAPTPFVAEVMRGAGLGDAVIEHPVVVPVPDAAPDRARFGIPAEAIAFGFAFGSEAVVDRKNPYAVIEAFRRAFPGVGSVCLAIRVNPTGDSTARVVEGLRRAAEDDPRILYLSGPLTYAEVLSFYASLDAYVSLHRAEGLGLGLMECMAVGTPVIATGWSGNMGFMSQEDSLLVGYDLVDVAVGPESPYSASRLEHTAQWAEPRVADAISAMRSIYRDGELRVRLSDAARTKYRLRLGQSVSRDLSASLGALMDGRGPGSEGHAERAASLRAIERDSQPKPFLRRVESRLTRMLHGE